jgi:glycogen synthase
MHVLMTTDTVGGVWSYAHDLVSECLRSGLDISLVCLGRGLTASQSEDVHSLSGVGSGRFEYISTEYKLEWMEDFEAEFEESANFLCKVIQDFAPDVMHLNQFCYGVIPVDIPKLVVAHSDVISWWRAVHGVDPEEERWINFYRRIVTEGLRCADAVIAPTRWMAEQICGIYGPAHRIRVISNGSNTEGIACSEQKHLQAVSLGRLWDAGKQVSLLEKVRTGIPIYVAGEVTAPGDQASRSGFHMNGVQYLGALAHEDVRNLLAASAIYIVTSRYEPFGLAPVEAALLGCAVVANDLPSLREVWGDSILYFEQNNPDALSAMLERLVTNKDELIHAAKRAQDHALSYLGHKQMAEQYLQLYRKFAQKGTCQ